MKQIIIIILGLILVGCGTDHRQPPGDLAPLELTNSDVIIDGENWTPLTDIDRYSEIAVNGRKVGQIEFEKADGTYVCTAFSIGKNQIMTNNHCIENSASSDQITFNIGKDKYDCNEFVVGNAALDFTVLKCSGDLTAKYGSVGLSVEEIPILGKSIYTIHYNCNYIANENCSGEILVSPGAIWKTAFLRSIKHDSDTLPGSSGGAIFDFTHNKVIALHNLGIGKKHDGRYNMANEMRKIVIYIYKNKPSVF